MNTSLLLLTLSAFAGGGGYTWKDLGDSCLDSPVEIRSSSSCCNPPTLRADFVSAHCDNNPRLIGETIPDGSFIQMNSDKRVRIYYVKDNVRHLVPDESTAESWSNRHGSELCAQTFIVPTELGETLPKGKDLTVRPGSGIIKIASEAKLYVIQEPSVLRRITYEQAEKIYGPSWVLYTRTLYDFVFIDYCIGPPLAENEPYDWRSISDNAMLSEVIVPDDCRSMAYCSESLP